jgi:hypothetical protein
MGVDNDYYDFVKLTESERAACESAYHFAMKLTHRKAKALYAADRAVFAQARRDRHQQQDEAAKRWKS